MLLFQAFNIASKAMAGKLFPIHPTPSYTEGLMIQKQNPLLKPFVSVTQVCFLWHT